MKLKIDYLNKEKQLRTIYVDKNDYMSVWYDLVTILDQWATDVKINLIKE